MGETTLWLPKSGFPQKYLNYNSRSSAHKGSAVLCVDFPKLFQAIDIRLVDALCSPAAPVIAAGTKFAVNSAAAPKGLLNDLNPLFPGSIFNQNRFHKDHRAFFLFSMGYCETIGNKDRERGNENRNNRDIRNGTIIGAFRRKAEHNDENNRKRQNCSLRFYAFKHCMMPQPRMPTLWRYRNAPRRAEYRRFRLPYGARPIWGRPEDRRK